VARADDDPVTGPVPGRLQHEVDQPELADLTDGGAGSAGVDETHAVPLLECRFRGHSTPRRGGGSVAATTPTVSRGERERIDGMLVQAYILVQTNVGKADQVAEEI